MPRLQNLQLSKADFDNSRWQDVIHQSDEKSCDRYHRIFFQHAAQAQKEGDAVREEVFTLLGAVSSMLLKPDTSEIFHPLFVFYDPPTRGFVLDDLSNEHLGVLAEIAPDASDSEMRARLADVVWVKGRSPYYKLVEIAVRAYVETFKTMLTSPKSHYFLAGVRLDRAISLARSIRNQSLTDLVLDEVEKIIFSRDPNDQEFPFAILLNLLLKYSFRNPNPYAELSTRLAKASDHQSNWLLAQVYWQLKAELDILAGNVEENRKSSVEAAEAYVKVGQTFVQLQPANYHTACFYLQQAIYILTSNVKWKRIKCRARNNG
ncbi:MAG: hypothetical protein SF029_19320 [bacterium]|nr:hypothetical protein [bacterium]